MAKRSKSIWPAIKKALPVLGICFVMITISYYALFKHYRTFSFIGGSDILYVIESKLLDVKLLLRGPQKPSGQIGILAIDEKSLKKFGRWPFSRRFYGQAFKNLKKLGVNWIGFDSIFSEPEFTLLSDAESQLKQLAINKNPKKLGDQLNKIGQMFKSSPADQLFSKAIKEFNNIVLGYFFFGLKHEADIAFGKSTTRFFGLEPMLSSQITNIDFPDGKSFDDYPFLKKAYGLTSNISLVTNASPNFAFFGNDADDDAINRWVTLVANVNGHLMPALSLKLVAEILNSEIFVLFDDLGIESVTLFNRENDAQAIEIPIDPLGAGRMLVNHRGPGRTFPHFSLADAYDNTFSEQEKKILKGASLLLGATATGINDMRPNPFDPSIDGVENHAAVIDNILRGDYFKRPVQIYKTELMIVLAIGLLFSPLMAFTRAALSGIMVVLFLIGYYYVDQILLFGKGTWTYMAIPCFEIIGMYITTTLYKYMTEERERKKIKGVFGLYLSPDVIDQVLEEEGKLALGGKRKELTVFFSDVRGFTTISESLTPEKLCEFMNTYFTPMEYIIQKNSGCLDKYIGDAIMAFWGAPLELPNHADLAAQSCLEMLLALDKLQVDLPARGFPKPDIGMGLNSGPMSVGNMGSSNRFSYTVMGDSVNLGSRLEGLTKEYGIKCLISEFTKKHLTTGKFFTRDLDDIRVKGKNEPVNVFELMRPDIIPRQDLIVSLVSHFEEGRKAYKGQNWSSAEKDFGECMKIKPDDGPTRLYLGRIKEYKEHPPGEAWDGVYTFKHK